MSDHVDVKHNLSLEGYHEIPFICVAEDVKLGDRVILRQFCNLYGCAIGDDTTIGAYTEIGQGVKIGKGCKIGARVFIPPGVTIGDNVFIGPGCTFTNDKYPKASGEWTLITTRVEEGASIGAGCVILPGVTIAGRVGAGSVVTKDVPKEVLFFNKRVNVELYNGLLTGAEKGSS